MAKPVLDSMVSELRGKITILEDDKSRTMANFRELLAMEQQKNVLLTGNIKDYQVIESKYAAEVKKNRKETRKLRWERNIAVGVGVILIAVAAVK